ncbi:MAG: hypothetical protein ACKOSS_05390, partial [Planctomycetia bacterium]
VWVALLALGTLGGAPRALQAEPPAAGGAAFPGAWPAAVVEARAWLRAQDARAALERLRAERPPQVAAPEVAWLWVQLAPAFEGRAAVLAALERLPASPLRLALGALLEPDASATCDRLRIALRRQASPWLQLALAHTLARLGEHVQVLGEASRLARTAPPFVALEATLLAARAHVHLGELEQALAAGVVASALAVHDARGPALQAEVLRRLGRAPLAREALRSALARAPRSEALARRLADLLREPGTLVTRAEWEATLRVLDPRNPEAEALRAMHVEALGSPAQALEAVERALAAGARPVPLEGQRRRLLAGLGRWPALLEALEAAVPAAWRQRPDNLLAPRWTALRTALAAAPAPGAGASAVEALATALVGVGALHEALAVLRGVPTPTAAALARRLEGQLAFEDALRAEVEAGYRDGHLHPSGG